MLPVSFELTLPESQRSGVSSCAALEATRISYAVCLPADSRQLRFGVASPSPIGLLNVFTRSVVGVTLPPAESAGATVLMARGTAPTMTSAAAKRPTTLDLKFSSLVTRRSVDAANDRLRPRNNNRQRYAPSRRGKPLGPRRSAQLLTLRSRGFPRREAR